MSFNIGDIVRVGKGKVDYRVSEINADGTVNLTGERSNRKNVATDGLTLITAARNAEHASEDAINAAIAAGEQESANAELTDEQAESLSETYADFGSHAAQTEKERYQRENAKRPVVLTIDGTVTRHRSYGAACDAFVLHKREHGFKLATINVPGRKLVTRKAA